jgi:hypothetical protein
VQSSDSGEDYSGGVVEPCGGAICSAQKTGYFPTWSVVMRLLSGKSYRYSSEKSRAKVHPDWRHFLKVLFENDLKIKNEPNPEYFQSIQ